MLPVPTTSSIALGRIASLETDGTASVVTDLDMTLRCVILESAVASSPLDLGDLVVVLRSSSSDDLGVVLGRPAQMNGAPIVASTPETRLTAAENRPETLVLEATEELTLRVGDGSITIRKDGKILIKGKDLVSHAQRVNRIKGGSVSIN